MPPDQRPVVSPSNGPDTQAPQGLQPHEFEFIVNPASPPRRSLKFGKSVPERSLLALGGLLVLIVIIVFISKLITGSNSEVPDMTAVAEAQQELLNLTSPATLSGNSTVKLSPDNSNVAATIQVVVTSNQAQLIKYLSTNGINLDSKALANYKVASLQQQLTAAASNGTYDSTFSNLIKSQIGIYQGDLRKAYTTLKGPKGQQLLNSEYNQSQLLLQQLVSPAS